MSVRVQCTGCGSPYAVAGPSLGKRMKCRKCGTIFVAEGPIAGGALKANDGAYDVEAPDVAPPAPTAAPTTVWDATRPSAAAIAAKAEQAKPPWRKPGVLVPVVILAVGGAIVAAVLLNRPAEKPLASAGGGGSSGTSSPATRPQNAALAAAAGPAGAARPAESSAADALEAEIGQSSGLFSVNTPGARKPPASVKPSPAPPASSRSGAGVSQGKSPTAVSPSVKSPAARDSGPAPSVIAKPGKQSEPATPAAAGAPAEPPRTADIQSSAKPTKWLVRPDPSKIRAAVVAKKLVVPVADAEVLFPEQPSPYVVAVHSRPDGFEWELWNIEDGKKTYSFKSKDVLAEMVISPDGILAAGIVPGRVNDVETWSLRQGTAGKRVREAEGEDTLVPVCFVGEKTLVTTVGGTRKLTLWNVVSGKAAGEVALDRDLQFGGTFSQSPGGSYLAMFADTRLLVYSLAEQELAGEVVVPERGDVSLDTAAGVTFSPDGSEIAGLFGGRGGPVRVVVWDMKTARVTADVIAADKPGERLPPGSAQAVRPLAWLFDGTGWLLYGDVAVARAGGKTLFRQKPGTNSQPALRWRPADRHSFLLFEGSGVKRVLKATPVPGSAK